MDDIERLRALEREWWWMNGALNAIAQAHADGLPSALRQITEQRRAVDQKRVEILMSLIC